MCCKNVARCANVSAENVFLFSIGFSEYRSTMSMFHKVYPLEPYSPGDPPWPSQSKADLGLVYEFFLKNVNFSVFIFGCTAIFSYFVSFLVSTSSALKEHHNMKNIEYLLPYFHISSLFQYRLRQHSRSTSSIFALYLLPSLIFALILNIPRWVIFWISILSI